MQVSIHLCILERKEAIGQQFVYINFVLGLYERLRLCVRVLLKCPCMSVLMNISVYSCYGGDDEARGRYRYIIFILLYYQITIAKISHILHTSDLRMELKLDNTFIQKKF